MQAPHVQACSANNCCILHTGQSLGDAMVTMQILQHRLAVFNSASDAFLCRGMSVWPVGDHPPIEWGSSGTPRAVVRHMAYGVAVLALPQAAGEHKPPSFIQLKFYWRLVVHVKLSQQCCTWLSLCSEHVAVHLLCHTWGSLCLPADGYWIEILNPAASGAFAQWKDAPAEQQ